MKTRALVMSVLFALAATPALAQASPPGDAQPPACCASMSTRVTWPGASSR